MLNKYIFNDEIIFFWDLDRRDNSHVFFSVYMDGMEVGKTDKTHFTVYGLNSDTEYNFIIYKTAKGKRKLFYSGTIKTASKRKTVDVSKPPYNAVGDGKTLNTDVLQKAIDDCKAGERLFIPKGVFLTGALNLKSGIEIFIEKGGILQGSEFSCDYLPKIKSRFEGITTTCYRSLLNFGETDEKNFDCNNHDLIIRGGGEIRGGGNALSIDEIDKEKEILKKNGESQSESEMRALRTRGRLINLSNCKNVIIADVKAGYGASWNIHAVYSENIVVCNCEICSEGIINGDGIDPDSCKNFYIFNVDFCTHDDCIAIKSGKNPEGNAIARPSLNIKISDCRGRNGIAIGSELSGGIKNVDVWDCKLINGVAGFRIKTTVKRGGYVKNVRVNRCSFAEIRIYTGYGCNDDGESSDCLTDIENVTISDTESFGYVIQWQMGGIEVDAPCVIVCGFNEKPIKNLSLKNVRIHATKENVNKKYDIKNVIGLKAENVYSVIGGEKYDL